MDRYKEMDSQDRDIRRRWIVWIDIRRWIVRVWT